MDWSAFPNFSEHEFACKHTGKCEMHPLFMERLQKLRTAFGKPMMISSGFRDKTHPVEARKGTNSNGAHTTGRACDVAIRGGEALRLIRLAQELGFTGIGVNQKGTARFIHLDDVGDGSLPRPNIWSY